MIHGQSNGGWSGTALAVLASLAVVASPAMAAVADKPTFAKDVAPILQAKCQECHRPGSMAPMSFLTYEDTRPWARSIKQRVTRREMPPWHLDKTIGIQHYKNDRSLSDEQIDTFVKWVDSGAPLGNPKDLPPPAEWPDDQQWAIGKPDLIVTTPTHTMYANGPDWWADYMVDTGLKEDRYIKAVETRPTKLGRRVVHHASTYMVDGIIRTDMPFDETTRPDGTKLGEYGQGKTGDFFAENTGRLIKAGSKIRFNMHYHAVGEEIADRTSVAFVFYPKGYQPKYKVEEANVGMSNGHLSLDVDIPPNSITRNDAYYRLPKAARLVSYQPHMHMRGKAMTMEAILPTGQVEMLSAVDHFDFNWHIVYVYDEDVAPLLPAGTVLHTIAIHDNTSANRLNPDPSLQVVFGQRSIDDMNQCHVLLIYLDDADYAQQLAQRTPKLNRPTGQQQ
jgi:hypothetical protein